MLWSKAQGFLYRAYPCFIRQLGKAEDQVDADVPDSTFAENPEGIDGSPRIMAAIHPKEDSIIERLDTHADPVHAKRNESADIFVPLFNYVLGVHLHGELIEVFRWDCRFEGW